MIAAEARLAKVIDALPTLPSVALQLGEIASRRDVSVPRVAELLRTNPATSARLLRLVNSPGFGIPGGVSDLARAIPFVGAGALHQLVRSISVLDTIGPRGGDVEQRIAAASLDEIETWSERAASAATLAKVFAG
jgi:HD-like signal output (HDOD) protein